MGDLPDARIAELAAITARLGEKRHQIAASPLGRLEAGRARGRAALADIVAASRLSVALQAVVDGDTDLAREQLAEMPPDLVLAIGEAAGTLAGLAAGLPHPTTTERTTTP